VVLADARPRPRGGRGGARGGMWVPLAWPWPGRSRPGADRRRRAEGAYAPPGAADGRQEPLGGGPCVVGLGRRVFIHALGHGGSRLQPVQEGEGALGIGGGLEHGPLVSSQDV
jgi:hypothetical protein